VIETELQTSRYWTDREMDSLQRIRYVNLALFILIVMAIWLFPFWRDTHKLIRIAEHFSKGDLSYRQKISRYAALYPIVQSLNTLASRIQVLLTSHKSLVNSAAHELRTPLTRLKYAQRLAHEAASTGELHQYLKQAEREVAALDELIDELLFYAQLDRNETATINVVSFTSDQWIFERIAAARGLAAAIAPDVVIRYKNSATMIVGERRSLDRIVSNLLGNAIRYATSTVQVTMAESSEGFMLSVEDDGAGISPADRKRIFEPFVRLDDARQKTQYGGTGLGLAIVARIAEMHGGRALVQDSELGGAKIVVTWPRQFAHLEHPVNEIDASNR
jgi:two-component system, OmpR family, sensor kinase ParS